MSVHVTRRLNTPLEPPAESSRLSRARVVLAALAVGALIASGVALGSNRLDTAYQWIVTADDSETELEVDADPDHDGLPTAVERAGVMTEAGDTFVTDPTVADTDDDGLSDGEEAGTLVTTSSTSPVYRGISDPLAKDTDDDGVPDGDEYFLGTNPHSVDTDDDGLADEQELDFGSDPLAGNPDDDAYSDEEERERGSAPMAYDESGWRAHVGTALAVLKVALSAADKVSGGGKLQAAGAAIRAAKAAGVAAPIIWNALRDWDWSDVSADELRDEVFGDEIDELGEALEGGQSDYVAYVARKPDGALAYVGITDDFKQLSANHGGLSTLSVVGEPGPMPLGQARAVAEAVVAGAHARMETTDLANTRHVIHPADDLYAPAIKWGSEQLELAGFEWTVG